MSDTLLTSLRGLQVLMPQAFFRAALVFARSPFLFLDDKFQLLFVSLGFCLLFFLERGNEGHMKTDCISFFFVCLFVSSILSLSLSLVVEKN